VTAGRVHLGYLDGLRGWAALYVVFHHVWQFVITRPELGPFPRWFAALTIFKFGSFAVTIFIALSGYCLMLPVARDPAAELAGGVAGFVRRRARRILPPYYATLGLALLILALYPRLRDTTGTQWDIALPALTPEALGSHAFLVHNLVEAWQWKIDPPLWSVALEWQIYFVFAIVLLPVWRRFGPLAALGLSFALGLAPIAFGKSFANTWFLGSFALGMLAAALNFSPSFAALRARRVPWLAIGAAFTAVVLVATALSKSPWFPAPLTESCLSAATAAFLVHTTDGLANGRRSRVVAALAHPVSAWLGAFSYSLYLVHFLVLGVLVLPLLELGMGPVALFVTLATGGVVVMVLTAYAFHLAFERPFLQKRVKVEAAALRGAA
jgi:peptidoglycan/LPS O-acetylase OafA/YrhL